MKEKLVFVIFGGVGAVIAAAMFTLYFSGLLTERSAESTTKPPLPGGSEQTPTTESPPTEPPPTTISYSNLLFLMTLVGVAAFTVAGVIYLIHRNRAQLRAYLGARSDISALTDSSQLPFDGDTELQDDHHKDSASDSIYHIFSGESFDHNHVRSHVQNAVKYENGKLFFYADQSDLSRVAIEQSPLADFNPTSLMLQVSQQKGKVAIGQVELVPEKGRLYPCPFLQAAEDKSALLEVYAEPTDALNFYYNPTLRQYYFSLAQESTPPTPRKISFSYRFKQNPFYFKNFSQDETAAKLFVKDPEKLFPPYLLKKLRDGLRSHAPLAFLFDEKLTHKQKLQHLIVYFQSFGIGKLTAPSGDDVDVMLAVIMQKKGVCRHRAEAFFLLARLIGIPVATYTSANRKHMVVNIPYQTADGVQYQQVELMTPRIAVTPQLSSIFRHRKSVEAQAHYARYRVAFNQALAKGELRSIQQILTDRQQIFSPLIELTKDQPAFAVNAQIVKQLRALGMDTTSQHLFINTPEEFAAYFMPIKSKMEK